MSQVHLVCEDIHDIKLHKDECDILSGNFRLCVMGEHSPIADIILSSQNPDALADNLEHVIKEIKSILKEDNKGEVSSDDTIMACGCVANCVVTLKDGSKCPGCIIHDCIKIAECKPNLEGREAKCPRCGKIVPSSFKLDFFRYMGPGSLYSMEICAACGMTKLLHTTSIHNHPFEPQPDGADYDEFYCGCGGWD